ncbi:hypothetical protein PTTG_29430 [Puccinia triticina 1-1 BBBD Race 1]|uniref:Uncharacterized protein n=1 Tax=Puccinia triticina (isolate 1-1 / race 1 (BBBD)) TaxID=630390 RepID=A0A180G6F6_PUCT1|nr:hypothetical protein PTTG_29430 [Puccinia triticina 1-1 BBBD Race 1]
MMGLAPNAKPYELPSSVTSEELQSWDTWRERRKDAFRNKPHQKKCDRPAQKSPNTSFFQKFSLYRQLGSLDSCEEGNGSRFSQAWISWFTFNWKALFVHDVVWNSVAVDITVRHWLPWAKRTNFDVAKSSIPGIKTRFFQWITNQGLSRVKAQVTPADVAAQRKHGQYVRSTKRKIATLRADTFLVLYPARKILGHLLRDPDAVSDFEEDDANTLPRRISAHWRSPAMENIIRSVDHVALKRAKTTQKKLSVKGLLARKDTRAPTAEEQIDQAIPTRFPRDAYDPNYLREEGDFQAEHLTSEAMDIDNLAKEMVAKSFGTRYCSPVNNGSAGPCAADQPAPTVRNLAGSSGPGDQMGSSGPEVQISG